ncbi:hypothetical protein OSB04_005755 [Centaurea solstitialis]|uniref:Reverse transcriptase zinc-binding domain-containing protein n=1 Tax=Centaurea solstitialis TaxID=347529 RepID=A0AA38TGN3_9ASTR|nr:hypothetical protein OSB04_005755 [Centaurea solstitialis]
MQIKSSKVRSRDYSLLLADTLGVINSIHGFRRGIATDPCETKKPGLWSSITKIKKELEELDISLTDFFYANPVSGPSSQIPTWIWSLEPSGVFSVSSLRRLIDVKVSPLINSGEMMWLKPVPSKVNIMIWRLKQKRLATLCNLFYRGISIDSLCCFLCKSCPESEEHLFGICTIFRAILISFASWWGVDASLVNSSDSLFSWGCNLGFNGKVLIAFNTTLYALCWVVWKLRNSIAFPSGDNPSSDHIGLIQSLSLFWLNSRGKFIQARELNCQSLSSSSFIKRARARARLLNELEIRLELGSDSFNSNSSRAFNESIPSSSRTARLTYTLRRGTITIILTSKYCLPPNGCWEGYYILGVSIGTGYPLLEPEPLWNRLFRNRCEWFRFLKYGTDTGYPVPVPKYEEPVQPVPVLGEKKAMASKRRTTARELGRQEGKSEIGVRIDSFRVQFKSEQKKPHSSSLSSVQALISVGGHLSLSIDDLRINRHSISESMNYAN